MKQFRYLGEDGQFDLAGYRRTQIAGNKRKLEFQWVSEKSIEHLSRYLQRSLSPIQSGICHGTRQGNEQKWFKSFLKCPVLGTEISDTASQFPDTIQWDFHETKPEWLDTFDFIYSNSWDHSYDPAKVFNAWMSCLRPGGLCILEHTQYHTVADQLDPLGFERDELAEFLNRLGRGKWKVSDILIGGPPVGVAGIEVSPDHIVVKRGD